MTRDSNPDFLRQKQAACHWPSHHRLEEGYQAFRAARARISSNVVGRMSRPFSNTVSIESERENCYWYAEATQYPADTPCPNIYDEAHGVWIGSLEEDAATASGSFSFIPASSQVVLCLYVDEGGESTLVGKSHPYSPSTHSELRYPSRTGVYVTVHGCKFKPHILINGSETPIGGRSAWALYRGREHLHGSLLANHEFGYFSGPAGHYRFTARFLGDTNLTASAQTATAVFRVGRCHARNFDSRG